jgi:hypothetical protein
MIGKGLFNSKKTYCCNKKKIDIYDDNNPVDVGLNCKKSTTGNCFVNSKFECDKEYIFLENDTNRIIIPGTENEQCKYIQSLTSKASKAASKTASVVGNTIVDIHSPFKTTENVRTTDGRIVTVTTEKNPVSDNLINGINRVVFRRPGNENTFGNRFGIVKGAVKGVGNQALEFGKGAVKGVGNQALEFGNGVGNGALEIVKGVGIGALGFVSEQLSNDDD